MRLDSGSAQIMRTCPRDPNWTRWRLKSDDNWNLETFINFTVFKPNHLTVKEDDLCHLYKFTCCKASPLNSAAEWAKSSMRLWWIPSRSHPGITFRSSPNMTKTA